MAQLRPAPRAQALRSNKINTPLAQGKVKVVRRNSDEVDLQPNNSIPANWRAELQSLRSELQSVSARAAEAERKASEALHRASRAEERATQAEQRAHEAERVSGLEVEASQAEGHVRRKETPAGRWAHTLKSRSLEQATDKLQGAAYGFRAGVDVDSASAGDCFTASTSVYCQEHGKEPARCGYTSPFTSRVYDISGGDGGHPATELEAMYSFTPRTSGGLAGSSVSTRNGICALPSSVALSSENVRNDWAPQSIRPSQGSQSFYTFPKQKKNGFAALPATGPTHSDVYSCTASTCTSIVEEAPSDEPAKSELTTWRDHFDNVEESDYASSCVDTSNADNWSTKRPWMACQSVYSAHDVIPCMARQTEYSAQDVLSPMPDLDSSMFGDDDDDECAPFGEY